MKTLAGKHRYFNAMFNYGREYSRICGGQHETKAAALAECRAALGSHDPVERPYHAWIEGFEKDARGNVTRIA
jgi:hypothetical protein